MSAETDARDRRVAAALEAGAATPVEVAVVVGCTRAEALLSMWRVRRDARRSGLT